MHHKWSKFARKSPVRREATGEVDKDALSLGTDLSKFQVRVFSIASVRREVFVVTQNNPSCGTTLKRNENI